MSDINREDERSDIQQAVEARADAAKAANGGDTESVGSDDGANGAGGVVKNQNDMQQ